MALRKGALVGKIRFNKEGSFETIDRLAGVHWEVFFSRLQIMTSR